MQRYGLNERMAASLRSEPVLESESSRTAMLDVVWPVDAADVALTSGRRVEVTSEEARDRIVVRGRQGEVELAIEMGGSGPILRFRSAELELDATREVRLAAENVSLCARGQLDVRAGGDMRVAVTGDRHTRVGGQERLEAGVIQLQASDADVEVRAMGRVALDGEHIGLNDHPCLAPFDWSEQAYEENADD